MEIRLLPPPPIIPSVRHISILGVINAASFSNFTAVTGPCASILGSTRRRVLHASSARQLIENNFAECAGVVEELARSNQSKFKRNWHSDVDPFLEKDEISGFQCSRCDRCFEKRRDANEHVRPGRTQCDGGSITELDCRKTIFGTVCPAPSGYSRPRIEVGIAAGGVSAVADAGTRRPLPLDLRLASAAAGTSTGTATSCPFSPASFYYPRHRLCRAFYKCSSHPGNSNNCSSSSSS